MYTIADYLVELDCKPSTVNTYRLILERVERIMAAEGVALMDVKRKDVVRLVANMREKKYAEATIRGAVNAVRAFFKSAKINGYDVDDTVVFFQFKQRTKSTPRYRISTQQAEHILRAVVSQEGKHRIRNTAMLAMFAYTGMRISELIRLRLQDVDFRSKTIYILPSKNGLDRVIVLHDDLVALLQAYLAVRPSMYSDRFFLGQGRGKITRSTITKMIRELSRSSGVAFGTHAFRHLLLTELHRHGMDALDIMQISGHTNMHSLKTHTYVIAEDVRNSYLENTPRYLTPQGVPL